MRRNANPRVPGHGYRFLALAIVLLIAGCGKSDQETGRKPHSVTLSWVASKSRVVGYNVYRSEKSGPPFIKLTTKPVSENKYVDTSPEAGKTYTYYVTSVDAAGAESLPSGKIVAAVPKP